MLFKSSETGQRRRLTTGMLAWIGLTAIQFAHAATAADVLVVTDSRTPVVTSGAARTIELDLPARIEGELSAGLPADPNQASALVLQRLQDSGGAIQARIKRAYQDNDEARSLGISKVPAVVIDRQFVVYGETNVDRAVARIEAHRKAAR